MNNFGRYLLLLKENIAQLRQVLILKVLKYSHHFQDQLLNNRSHNSSLLY